MIAVDQLTDLERIVIDGALRIFLAELQAGSSAALDSYRPALGDMAITTTMDLIETLGET